MSETFFRLDRAGVAPVESRPDPARLVSGDPVHTSWDLEERADAAGALYAGLWQSTPGAWRVRYDEWEYCHILAGHSVLCAEDGTRHELRAGDSIVIRPGFAGVWEVIETTLKDYVIRV